MHESNEPWNGIVRMLVSRSPEMTYATETTLPYLTFGLVQWFYHSSQTCMQKFQLGITC